MTSCEFLSSASSCLLPSKFFLVSLTSCLTQNLVRTLAILPLVFNPATTCLLFKLPGQEITFEPLLLEPNHSCLLQIGTKPNKHWTVYNRDPSSNLGHNEIFNTIMDGENAVLIAMMFYKLGDEAIVIKVYYAVNTTPLTSRNRPLIKALPS